jgi:hypothetical protein
MLFYTLFCLLVSLFILALYIPPTIIIFHITIKYISHSNVNNWKNTKFIAARNSNKGAANNGVPASNQQLAIAISAAANYTQKKQTRI